MKKIGKFSRLIIVGIIIAIILPGMIGSVVAQEQGNHEVVVELEDGKISVICTFENALDFEPIDPLLGLTKMYIPPNWRTLTTGGNPSIMWWQGDGYTYEYADILFIDPVSAVSLMYSSAPDIDLEAFDTSENLLATNWGLPNYTPDLSIWYPLDVDVGENIITRIRIYGGAWETYIDDVTVTRLTDRQICSIDVNPNDPTPIIDLTNDETVSVAVLSTDSLDTTKIGISSIRVGDPGSDTTVAPISWEEMDVNGDSRIDISMVFSVQEMIDSGALDEYTIQFVLIGSTQTAVYRLDETRLRLIENDINSKAAEKLAEVTQRLEDDSFGVIGVVDVNVVSTVTT